MAKELSIHLKAEKAVLLMCEAPRITPHKRTYATTRLATVPKYPVVPRFNSWNFLPGHRIIARLLSAPVLLVGKVACLFPPRTFSSGCSDMWRERRREEAGVMALAQGWGGMGLCAYVRLFVYFVS